MKKLYRVFSRERRASYPGRREGLVLVNAGELMFSFLDKDEAIAFAERYNGEVRVDELEDEVAERWQGFAQALATPVKDFTATVSFAVPVRAHTVEEAEFDFMWQEDRWFRQKVKDNLVIREVINEEQNNADNNS